MMRLARRGSTFGILLAAVALAACSATGASPSTAAATGGELVGKTWQWIGGTTTDPASQHVVPNPDSYTVTFNEDDTFNATVDCNQLSGSYTAGDDGSLSVTPGPATLAACPEGSLADLFVAQLSAASEFVIDGETLRITDEDSATMEFN